MQTPMWKDKQLLGIVCDYQPRVIAAFILGFIIGSSISGGKNTTGVYYQYTNVFNFNGIHFFKLIIYHV